MCLVGGCSSTSAHLHKGPAQFWQRVETTCSRAADRCECVIVLAGTQRHISTAIAKTPS